MRFDAVVIPGGLEGVENIQNAERFASLAAALKERGALFGAVCAAPLVLDGLKLITAETRITSHPSVRKHLESKYVYTGEAVETDGRIVTGSGVGTAIPFALKIIEILAGKDISQKVADGIDYRS